jgi:hypothetical protein
MSAIPHARVITDKDIAEKHRITKSNSTPTTHTAMRAGAQTAKPTGAFRRGHTSAVRLRNDPASRLNQREPSVQQRTAAIHRPYLDRITTLREQVNTAKLELVKLQGGAAGTATYSGGAFGSNDIPASEVQTSDLTGLIQAQRALITSLETQLENAQELARHAGIRPATD